MPDKLTANDWSLVAHWVSAEKERRANDKKRKELEGIWKEIDRQVAMEPLPREKGEGSQNKDWLPDTELPLQFNTLEVNAADARRLKFPRGSEWYSVSSNVSDEYIERFERRRISNPMIGDKAVLMKADFESANTLVKASMDFFHRLYDFRGAVDMFDVESIKYGTGVLRVREVASHKFPHDFRGIKAKTVTGPAIIPVSIKRTFLDDTPIAIMGEGIMTSPVQIMNGWKHVNDIKRSIKVGGPERGWRKQAINKIEPPQGVDDKSGYIEYLQAEGDLIVPRNSGESIFLPNAEVTVAIGRGGPEVVRYKENKYSQPFWAIGHYMRDKLDTPYGTSPLVKGQPLQEAAVAALNSALTGAALNALPPGSYDRNDAELQAAGGPRIFPGAMNATDSPNAVEFMDSIDVGAIFNVYLGILKQYEDTTAVNDPRRGGAMRSHTTARASDNEQSRGLSRTDDFVQGQEQGPLTSILYMEYEILKKSLTSPMEIPVDADGIEGWVKMAGPDLPDEVAFRVHGSQGVLNERQSAENFLAATNMIAQLQGIAAQMGQPISMDWRAIALEIYKKAGENNAAKFIPAPTGDSNVPPGVEGGQQVPSTIAGLPQNDLTDLAAGF